MEWSIILENSLSGRGQQGAGVGVESGRWGGGQGKLASRKIRCISIPHGAARLANAFT